MDQVNNMGNETNEQDEKIERNEYYDLRALLLHNALNIRRFAEANPFLSTGEYFDKVTQFLDLVPDVSRALGKFENREGDKEDRRSLNNMINLLGTMECDRFVVEFHAVLDSYEREGNWRLAATHAKKIRDDFNSFGWEVMKTKKTAEEINKPDQENSVTIDRATAIGETIRLLNEEETSRKLVILAIDDSPVILKSVWSVLKDDYKVLTLSKPEEIDKIISKQDPDLFLLDYMMPELNGFDLIPIIREYEKFRNTPIVFLTSEGSIDNVTSALALGAKDYIVKPFKPETLREKVKKQLG